MYADLANTAKSLLSQFGATRTLTRTTVGAFDPLTGLQTTTTATHSVSGVKVGITEQWRGSFFIQAGDAVFIIEAGAIEPRAGDSIDGWTVIAVEPVEPGGIAVIYKCHVRES